MAFNVDHLLNTNSTPSQEQRHVLQNFILQLDEAILNADEGISDINNQILAMQAKILVFQTKRTQLVQQRRRYSSLLSTVRCLPIEIFGKIFVYATLDRPRHVLNISAVCQLWRDAALGTPMLWSMLELGHHTTSRNMDNHINSWIERARSYPLSLVIKKKDGFLDPVHNILTLITKYRWESITLDSSNISILSILKELESSNLETLESFSLVPRFSRHFESSLLDALQFAPKLKTLSLLSHYPVAFDALPFPWRQLTNLTIGLVWNTNTPNFSMDILQACVNLEEFTLEGDGSGLRRGSDDSITLNYLRKLHTHCIDNTFLLSLKTPSIQDLSIWVWCRSLITNQSNSIFDYIKKHSSTLLKLSIAPLDTKFIESIPYLRCLVKLKIHDNERGGQSIYEVLNSLVVSPEMDPFTIPLPRLEVLEIICQATGRNQGLFMKVINSRWWSNEEENTRLKQGQRSLSRIKRSVLMNVLPGFNMFYKDDVDILRAQGMSIEYLANFDGGDDFYLSQASKF